MRSAVVKRPGFILILALCMLSMVIVLVTGLFNRVTPFQFFDATVIKREKAKMLAFSGVQLAMAQLQAKVPKKDGKEGEASPKQQQEQQLFSQLLPTLNRWQTVTLDKKSDGIAGKIAFAISCEQGKLNINELFDFKTKKFVGEGKKGQDMKKVMQTVFARIAPYTNGTNLFSVFEKFLKQRQYKLHDVTQLLQIKEFQKVFGTLLFYEPPAQKQFQLKKGKKQPVYLTDLFTIWSDDTSIGAWVLSDAVCALFGFKRPQAGDSVAARKKIVEKAITQKALTAGTLEQVWQKGLQDLYGKEFKAIPRELQQLLRSSFEADMFSVVSQATVGNISQKIFAIIERRKSEGDNPTTFIIKRLYWL